MKKIVCVITSDLTQQIAVNWSVTIDPYCKVLEEDTWKKKSFEQKRKLYKN